MRLVLALIQPTKLKAVQEALHKIGDERMTVCDALGYGQQRGTKSAWNG
jgi:nitrogen regulatory protein PII